MTTTDPNAYHPDELVTRSEPVAPAKRRGLDRFLDARAILGGVGETLAEERAQRIALQSRVELLERELAELKNREPDRRLRAVPTPPPVAVGHGPAP